MPFNLLKQTIAEKYNNSAFVSKLKNKEFREGVAAGCALVAMSDNKVGPHEYERFNDLIENSKALVHFDKNLMRDEFETFVKRVKYAKREVWEELDQVPADQLPSIIDMMMSMAESEDPDADDGGEIDPKEKAVIVQAIQRFKLNARDWPGLS